MDPRNPPGPRDFRSTTWPGSLIRGANDQDLPWRRDDVDMYAVHVDVPQGVDKLKVSLDFLAVPGGTAAVGEDGSTSANLGVCWSGTSVVVLIRPTYP